MWLHLCLSVCGCARTRVHAHTRAHTHTPISVTSVPKMFRQGHLRAKQPHLELEPDPGPSCGQEAAWNEVLGSVCPENGSQSLRHLPGPQHGPVIPRVTSDGPVLLADTTSPPGLLGLLNNVVSASPGGLDPIGKGEGVSLPSR